MRETFTNRIMKRIFQAVLSVMVLTGLTSISIAQTPTRTQPIEKASNKRNATVFNNGIGFDVLMNNSGFAFGGYYQSSIDQLNSFIAEFYLGSVKHAREQKFFSYFGGSYIPNKENYLMVMQTQFGLQRRLFEESISENFRPFVQVSGGPLFGYESPYFHDVNNDGIRNEDEQSRDIFSSWGDGSFKMGADGFIGIGASFGINRKVQQGLKVGYSMMYFFDGIQLLDVTAQPEAQKFFGGPMIVLTFGRIR